MPAEPFIASLSFYHQSLDKWESRFYYTLSIDKDVITFYGTNHWKPNQDAFARLRDFDLVIPRNHPYHSQIDHNQIPNGHSHLKYKKTIDKAILTEFLEFIDASSNIVEMIVSDFQDFIELKNNVKVESRHYSQHMGRIFRPEISKL